MSKVEIGSKYDGPCFDKPCLRRLPIGWVLEGSIKPDRFRWWQRTDKWVAIVVALLLLVACAQAIVRAVSPAL